MAVDGEERARQGSCDGAGEGRIGFLEPLLAALLGFGAGVFAALLVTYIHEVCDYGLGLGGFTLLFQVPVLSVLGAVVGLAVFLPASWALQFVMSRDDRRMVAWTVTVIALIVLVSVDVTMFGPIEGYGPEYLDDRPEYCA